jgi:hypothetical protein
MPPILPTRSLHHRDTNIGALHEDTTSLFADRAGRVRTSRRPGERRSEVAAGADLDLDDARTPWLGIMLGGVVEEWLGCDRSGRARPELVLGTPPCRVYIPVPFIMLGFPFASSTSQRPPCMTTCWHMILPCMSAE